ncbi:hypothetical protein PR048_019171 [Dryococelus australis]|uniref:Uncharacterized protein n=1 Tax=Dryococelus australis TaxID=614101 RepID=A0ABQ9H2U0_9NEOP|nr:hypothetical protein PR048_019171 [Dryococelus australis]
MRVWLQPSLPDLGNACLSWQSQRTRVRPGSYLRRIGLVEATGVGKLSVAVCRRNNPGSVAAGWVCRGDAKQRVGRIGSERNRRDRIQARSHTSTYGNAAAFRPLVEELRNLEGHGLTIEVGDQSKHWMELPLCRNTHNPTVDSSSALVQDNEIRAAENNEEPDYFAMSNMGGEEKPIGENNVGEKRPEKDAEKVTMTAEELEELYKNHPLTEDTTCGIGFLKGRWLQRFSNENCFVCMYGLVGCLYGAGFAYFNGTISTIEKRFKIPSKVSECWPFGAAYLLCDGGVFDELHASRPLGGPVGLQVWAPRGRCRPRIYERLPSPSYVTLTTWRKPASHSPPGCPFQDFIYRRRMIVVGHDFSALLVGLLLSYYAGKQHRPRWTCLGIYSVVLYCLLTLLPHLLYGVGDDALALTLEYGGSHFINSSQNYVVYVCRSWGNGIRDRIHDLSLMTSQVRPAASDGHFTDKITTLTTHYLTSHQQPTPHNPTPPHILHLTPPPSLTHYPFSLLPLPLPGPDTTPTPPKPHKPPPARPITILHTTSPAHNPIPSSSPLTIPGPQNSKNRVSCTVIAPLNLPPRGGVLLKKAIVIILKERLPRRIGVQVEESSLGGGGGFQKYCGGLIKDC